MFAEGTNAVCSRARLIVFLTELGSLQANR
jgi:hypothetical protein